MTTWRERVAEARARGKFDHRDLVDAGLWATCAVGEQHAALPSVVVYAHDEPVDGVLLSLGGYHGRLPDGSFDLFAEGDRFLRAISDNDFAMADRCLDQIEDRVLQLKRGEA